MLEAVGVRLREKKTESNSKALRGKSVDVRAGTTMLLNQVHLGLAAGTCSFR